MIECALLIVWRYILNVSVFFISVFLKSLPAPLVLKKLSSSPNCHLHGALDFILSDTNKTPGYKLIFLYFMQSRRSTWANNLLWQEYFMWWWKCLRLLAYNNFSNNLYIFVFLLISGKYSVFNAHFRFLNTLYVYICFTLSHICKGWGLYLLTFMPVVHWNCTAATWKIGDGSILVLSCVWK